MFSYKPELSFRLMLVLYVPISRLYILWILTHAIVCPMPIKPTTTSNEVQTPKPYHYSRNHLTFTAVISYNLIKEQPHEHASL